MKKKLLFLMAAFALFVPSVMAADVEVTEDLVSAVKKANSGDTLKLKKDTNFDVSETIAINKDLTLVLDNNTITFLNIDTNFKVDGGKFTVKGSGTIKEKNPDYAPILVFGSTDKTAKDYSVVTIGEKVTLEGWAGIFIRQTASNTAYGVKINFNGKINSVLDVNKKGGHGIFINGKIIDTENAPVITIGDGAEITSLGTGVYGAGYATWNIGEAQITGVGCGLAIKSGVFNINGATIKATGENEEPDTDTNGINNSGAAIQIESNVEYAGNIKLNITDGTFISEKGVAVYEYSDNIVDDTAVKEIKIEGGEFTSAAGKPVMVLSDKFTTKHTKTGFISGGTYKSGTKETIVETIDFEYLPVEETIKLTTYSYIDGEKDDEDYTYIKKGTALGKEIEESLKKLFEEEDGLVYNGTFTDDKFKNSFDYTKELNEDSVMYISLSASEKEAKEENPETGDMNLALILSVLGLASVGTVFVSRKKLAKVSR